MSLKSFSFKNYLIYIKDPFSGLNVSKSSFKVREIQFAFSCIDLIF